MKLNVTKKELVLSAIADVQLRSKEREIGYNSVASAVIEIEKRLANIGLTKKLMVGLSFKVDPNAQEFPKAYKYEPVSTVFYLERTSSSWFIVRMERERCERRKITMLGNFSDEQNEAILKNARKSIER